MQLQTFGIEIRKIGDIKSLYQEVDLVLSKHEIKERISPSVAVQTVAHTLNKMFKVENAIYCSDIKNLAEICQICISRERMKVYESIHCMHWNEMLPEYRQLIISMILDDFRGVLLK